MSCLKASPSLTVEEKDVLFLKQWINGLYLGTDVQSKINSEFIQNSSIQLGKFLTKSLSDRISALARENDYEFLSARSQQDPSVPAYGESGCGAGWTVLGPPHKQRYVQMDSRLKQASSPTSSSPTKLTLLMKRIRDNLMTSAPFGRFIKRICSLGVKGAAVECRRFRPGMDYTSSLWYANKGDPT